MNIEPGFQISEDKSLLQVEVIQRMLNKTYWGKGRTVDEIQKTIANSRCYGVYLKGEQIGFARVLTDEVAMAYLSDMLIDDRFQGQGIGQQLLDYIFNDKPYQHVQRWILRTLDAHSLYEKFGFTAPEKPEVYMEKVFKPWSGN